MDDFVAFIEHLAWPTVAFFALIAIAVPVIRLLWVLASKIDRAQEFSLGKDGIKFTDQLAEVSLRLAATEVRQDNIKAVVFEGQSSVANREQAKVELDRLAAEYVGLNIADYGLRVEKRSELADRMSKLVITFALDRNTLVNEEDEGHLVALATAVLVEPKREDVALLEKSSKKADFNFTRYRIVLALSVLIARRLVGAGEKAAMTNLLSNVRHSRTHKADTSLLIVIRQAEKMIENL